MVSSSEEFKRLDLAHVHACTWFKNNLASMIFMFSVFISSPCYCSMLVIQNAWLWPLSLSSWSLPSLLLAFACTKQKYCLCIQNPWNQSYAIKSPLYLPIYGITLSFQVNLHVSSLNLQMNICFLCPYNSWSGRGSQYLHYNKTPL